MHPITHGPHIENLKGLQVSNLFFKLKDFYEEELQLSCL